MKFCCRIASRLWFSDGKIKSTVFHSLIVFSLPLSNELRSSIIYPLLRMPPLDKITASVKWMCTIEIIVCTALTAFLTTSTTLAVNRTSQLCILSFNNGTQHTTQANLARWLSIMRWCYICWTFAHFFVLLSWQFSDFYLIYENDKSNH